MQFLFISLNITEFQVRQVEIIHHKINHNPNILAIF